MPPLILCVLHGSLRNRLTLVSLAATDIALLLMMLVGLVRLHHGGYATFGMAQLLWKQVWWIFSRQLRLFCLINMFHWKGCNLDLTCDYC